MHTEVRIMRLREYSHMISSEASDSLRVTWLTLVPIIVI